MISPSNLKLSAALLILGAGISSSHAATLLSYNFGTVGSETLDPTGGDLQASGSAFTAGGGAIGGAGNTPASTLTTNSNGNPPTSGTAQGYDAALASQIVVGGTGDTGFVQFVLTTPVGGIDLDTLSVEFASGGSLSTAAAVRGSQVRYSFDGFATNSLLSTVTLDSSNSNPSNQFVSTGSLALDNQVTTGGPNGDGLTTSDVTFRFYGFATTTATAGTPTANQTGAVRFDNVILTGSIPEPATAALLGLGSLLLACRRRA